MKKTKRSFFLLCAAIFIGIAISSVNCAGAGGSIGVNISDQPVWGPTGYDRADFYYIPDIDSYYSVSEHEYIYREGPGWGHGASLPSRYSSYDPYHSYKVVVTGSKPYENNNDHQAKYSSFKGVKNQPVIRDSNDPKYFVNKDHPQHATWEKQQKKYPL